ncbi:MAG: hypothetical protein ACI9OU_002486 [Candidatus Promineifilaceae bacterium]|jgi:hypothetical protein
MMRMKNSLSALFLLTAILFSSGCLDAQQTLVIQPDGSGTLAVDYSIAEDTVKRIGRMLDLSENLPGSETNAPPASPNDVFIGLLFNPKDADVKARLDNYAKLGFEIEDYSFKSKKARRQISFKLKFDDLSVFSKADFFHTYGFSLSKNSQGQYVIQNSPVTTERPSSEWDFSDPEIKKLVAPFLNGFRFSLKIQLPGRITNSNAHHTRGNELEWVYAFDRDPYAIQKLQLDHVRVVFESPGATLPSFNQPPRPSE